MATFVLATFSASGQAQELLISDFESDQYIGWTITGDAFGKGPADGTLQNQMQVAGYRGEKLVNSFYGGDLATGTATSSPFVIERSHIAFLIGGGADQEQVGMALMIEGNPVRRATGSESESLEWASWAVSEFAGKTAQLQIYDHAVEGWGHISVDHIVQTNNKPQRFDLDYRLGLYRESPNYMNEPFRPQFHFSPEINWMNDPNGLVYHDGEYHLFYQYNPAGNEWGHMSWGHAVSRDLVHWEHLPLAIPEEDGIMAFSGCCVVDHHNTSGFGTAGKPPMVAVYTGHGRGEQVQNLAFSNDNGRSWTKFSGNPVLDINQADFRDPKVFWHEPTSRWVMVVSMATEKVIVFYSSTDLKNWDEVSRFGPAGAKEKLNWECPDLFELACEGEDGKSLWVLEADMGNGALAGGSGGEYFVGHFDGTRFTPIQDARWVDFGRDFYAPVSWSNVPASDGRRLWLGWFNNWETCLVPTSPWRSTMSVPRSLHLRRVPADDSSSDPKSVFVLVQRPVEELKKLRKDAIVLDTSTAKWPPIAVTKKDDLDDMVFELEALLKPGNARSLGFRIRTGPDEYTEIGYDQLSSSAYVDRMNSGNTAFHDAFAARHDAPVQLVDGAVKVRLLVDRCSIELFVNDGEVVVSDLIFPSGQKPIIEAFVGGDSASITDAVLYPLKSALTLHK